MLTEEKRKKFKRMLRNGEPDGEIKQRMQSKGYTQAEIDEVFAPVEKNTGIWFIISTVVSLLSGMILFNKEPAGLSLLSFLISAFCLYQVISYAKNDKAKFK
jgi:hypothetical protein